MNNKVSVIGGITNRTLLTTEDNIGVVSDGTDNLKVRLAKDLRGITSISNGDTKITLKDHCEDAVTITGGNINVTNNRITNLKDGEDEHDAVNKGQLDKAVDGIKQGAFGVTLMTVSRLRRTWVKQSASAATEPIFPRPLKTARFAYL